MFWWCGEISLTILLSRSLDAHGVVQLSRYPGRIIAYFLLGQQLANASSKLSFRDVDVNIAVLLQNKTK